MLFKVLGTVVLAFGLTNCTSIKPYEKEYLLDPTMEDGGVAVLSLPMALTPQQRYEKLATNVSGAAAGTSCPTCGG